MDSIAKWLIVGGLGIAALGVILFLASKIPGLNQLGSLPGDIRWQSADGRVSCFVPIVSMLLISFILTVVLNVIVRLLNRP
jgi:ABC-type sulfate transport system permease component